MAAADHDVRDVLAAAALVLAAVLLATMQSTVGFVGWDTYPIIAASRIASIEDLRGTFTEWLAQGYFPFGFYRPVLNLSMAADHAVWGLDPFGYRLTNLIAFAVCGYALFRLCRRLLGSDASVGPFVTLATFVVLPLHRELTTGPFANRGDLLCGMFVVFALLLQLDRLGSGHRTRQLLPVACTVLAQASKETAFVLPGLVFVLALLALPPQPVVSRLWRACALALGHAAGVLLVLAARTIVVGGIAGHAKTDPGALLSRLPDALEQVVLGLLVKRPTPAPPGSGVLTLLIVLACGGALLLARFRARVRNAASAPALVRASDAIILGLTMLAAFAAVYAIVGWVVPWYLFLPGLGLALVCGGGAEALTRIARHGMRAARVASCAALLALGVWLAWLLATSPLVLRDPVWSAWTRRNDAFFATLEERLVERSDETIRIAYPSQVLQPYTIQAWLDLVVPDLRATAVTAVHAPAAPGAGVTVVLVPEPFVPARDQPRVW